MDDNDSFDAYFFSLPSKYNLVNRVCLSVSLHNISSDCGVTAHTLKRNFFKWLALFNPSITRFVNSHLVEHSFHDAYLSSVQNSNDSYCVNMSSPLRWTNSSF